MIGNKIIYIRKALILTVFLWLILAILRLGYYLFYIFPMELPLLYKTIEEKREIQFGESYNFFLLVSSIVPKNSNVLFYTPSGEIYFSSRYFLFPRIVDFAKNEKDFSTLLLKGKYDYLIIFFTNDHSYDGATQYFPNLEKFKVIKSYVKKNEYTYKGAIIKL